MLWWIILFILSAVILFSFDGAALAFDPDADVYKTGWRQALVPDPCNCFSNCAVRALYLTFNTMINPLGLLGHRSLLIPANGLLLTFELIQGLLSVILIALTILAIRRRFKVQ